MNRRAPKARGVRAVGESAAQVVGHRLGVTLLELMVVLGLIVAIMALAGPLFMQSMRDRALQDAGERMVAGLDAARAHAQREGVVVEVIASAGGRRMVATEWSPDGGEARPVPALFFELPAPVSLVVEPGEETLVIFLPDGSAPAARRCVLRGDEALEALVTISPMLGRASVTMRARREDGEADLEEDDSDDLVGEADGEVLAPESQWRMEGRAPEPKGVGVP